MFAVELRICGKLWQSLAFPGAGAPEIWEIPLSIPIKWEGGTFLGLALPPSHRKLPFRRAAARKIGPMTTFIYDLDFDLFMEREIKGSDLPKQLAIAKAGIVALKREQVEMQIAHNKELAELVETQAQEMETLRKEHDHEVRSWRGTCIEVAGALPSNKLLREELERLKRLLHTHLGWFAKRNLRKLGVI